MTWMEDADYPFKEWQHEVGNGDTRLGYAQWVSHKKEMAGPVERTATIVIVGTGEPREWQQTMLFEIDSSNGRPPVLIEARFRSNHAEKLADGSEGMTLYVLDSARDFGQADAAGRRDIDDDAITAAVERAVEALDYDYEGTFTPRSYAR